MKKLLQFLSSDSPYSTMRLGFITIIAAGLSTGALCAYNNDWSNV